MPRARTPSASPATDEARADSADTAPQAESADKPQRGIQALDATGELLAALVAAGTPLSLRDLAAAAGMPSAKAFPHLVSLLKTGLLARDEAGRYEAGPLSLELGLLGLARLSPVREADSELVDLAASTGMSVALAVPGPLGPTVVRLEESPQPLHVSLRPGTVMSLVNTAIGRVFAAWLDDDVRAELLAQDGLRLAGVPSHSPSPSPQPPSSQHASRQAQQPAQEAHDPRYAERLAAIRAQRLDTALGNPIPGISTVAAPVFDHTGSVCLVLALMGPSGNFDTANESDSAQRLAAAAERLSRRFGYVPGAAPL